MSYVFQTTPKQLVWMPLDRFLQIQPFLNGWKRRTNKVMVKLCVSNFIIPLILYQQCQQAKWKWAIRSLLSGSYFNEQIHYVGWAPASIAIVFVNPWELQSTCCVCIVMSQLSFESTMIALTARVCVGSFWIYLHPCIAPDVKVCWRFVCYCHLVNAHVKWHSSWWSLFWDIRSLGITTTACWVVACVWC